MVKKAADGMSLDPDYMIKLLNFVTTTSRKRREGDRATALEQRRECYKASNWDEYKSIVSDQFMKEDQMCQVIMMEALEFLTETNE